MAELARSMGVALHVEDIRSADDLPRAFVAASSAGAQGLLVTQESMFIVHRAQVTELAGRHKLPAVYPFLLSVTDAGGLMAYTARTPELYKAAAGYVDQILKGAKIADLPVRQPTQFDLLINLKTARSLGIAIPATLRLRATELIE